MKQSITLSEVYKFINESYCKINKNGLYIDSIVDRFRGVRYNNGGFAEYIEEDYHHYCETYCEELSQESKDLHEQINILMKLFEIDYNLENEYQDCMWEETKMNCSNHNKNTIMLCLSKHGDCNDTRTILNKEAEEFAHKMYDEDYDVQNSLYREYKKEMIYSGDYYD
tara:strand:+ start:333 stop:836 length:504 start_codon:yes stop_codon:yes gene_type:complete